MNKYIWLSITSLFLSVAAFAQTEQDAAMLLQRYRHLLLADTSFSSAKKIAETDAAGMWSDIDYADNQPGVWMVGEHLRRVKVLAQNWAIPSSALYHDEALKNKISRALGHWLKVRYKNKNWWHNEIGIPQLMRDIIVLMDDGLSPDQQKQAMQVLGQYKIYGTGANLVWSADLGLHYGAMKRDFALMKVCRDTIMTTIKITKLEGVQPDYSFLQHGARLQIYSYGEAFLRENVRLAWQLRGSGIAYPTEKIKILADFTLNGWQWMARGIQTVPGTIDRSVSRKNGLGSPDIRKMIPLLYDLQPERIALFKRMMDIQNGKVSLKGYRYFPYADFTAFHQPGFSFFLKSYSSRTLLMEAINQENLSGDLLNAGDAYFMSDGEEYYNLMPLWDWDRLPGITNFLGDRKDKVKKESFVGNVSDGNSGLAVMDYKLEKNKQSLTAHKFWANHQNITVALISGLKTVGLSEPAFTVMDQSRWIGPVTVDRANQVLKGETKVFNHLKWIHHANFVYMPISKTRVKIKLTDTTGRWTSINRSQSNDLIKGKVFMASILHSNNEPSSGYVVAYAKTVKQAAGIAKKPSWKVLFNDEDCQSVAFKNGPLMAAFYTVTGRSLNKYSVSVNQPCLILIQNNKLFISDPSHKGGMFSVKINGFDYIKNVPADGTSVQILLN